VGLDCYMELCCMYENSQHICIFGQKPCKSRKMLCIIRKCLHSCLDGKTKEIKATMQLIHTCEVIQCFPSIHNGLGH
jgi:hypothetical protein